MAKKETLNEEKNVKETRKSTRKVAEEIIESTTKSINRQDFNIEPKNNHLGLILGILAVFLVGLLLVVSIIQTNNRSKYYKEITLNEFKEIAEKDEIGVVYWARPGCYYCQQFKPTVMTVTGKYKIVFNYLNTDNLDYDGYTYMYEKMFIPYDSTYETYKEEDGKGVGTPAVLIVRNGKIVEMSVGAISENQLVAFLQENGAFNS